MVRKPVPAWHRSLSEALSSVGELLDAVGLRVDDLPDGVVTDPAFPVQVPRELADRIRPGDPRDPILLQVLPSGREADSAPGFGKDPLEEREASPAPGVVAKYRGRVLFVTVGACGVHCRYCFRRHFPYDDHRPWAEGWEGALAFVRDDPSIREVILSGGDPLVVGDDKLADLASELDRIPHLRRLRVHTRMPVVVPSRVDERLLGWLGSGRLGRVVVLHANHANEIDGAVRAAVDGLRRGGVTVLNQSVLLRGVNDDVAALRDLSEALFGAGVLPYYLHLLDRVEGAAHFDVDEKEAARLVGRLMAELPGYLVPKLVREVPGEPAKVPVEVRPELPG